MKKLFSRYSMVFLASTVPLFSMMSDQDDGGRKSETVIVASPAYDFSFKWLFGQEKHLINFLNSLFYPNAGEDDLKIRELTYNPEASIPGKRYKHIYFDISCTCTAYAKSNTRSGHGPEEVFKFDVEMQRKGLEEYYKRSVFYGARLFSQDAESAVSYSDVTPVRVVSFLRESFRSPCEAVVYKIEPMICVQNPDDGLTCTPPPEQTMEWVYIQLDKLPGACEGQGAAFEQWMRFMNLERSGDAMATEGYAYSIERDKFTDSGVREAINEMERIVKTQFRVYQKSVEDERADAMMAGEEQKRLAKARAEAEAERAKAQEERAKAEAERERADSLAQEVAALKRQLQEVTASQAKKFKTSASNL